MALFRGNHECLLKSEFFIHVLGELQQHFGLDAINFVDGQDHALAFGDLVELRQYRLDTFGNSAMGLDE